LSAAIKKLENEIGAPLFNREGSGITLTEIGKEYVDSAEKIMIIQEDFNRKLKDIFELNSGKIDIGGSNFRASYLLSLLCIKFKELYPNIETNLIESNSLHLYEMLDKGQVDIIIDNLLNPEKYNTHVLTTEKIFLCIPKKFPINKKLNEYAIPIYDVFSKSKKVDSISPLPLKMIEKEKFILLKDGNDMRIRAESLFEKAGISPNIALVVDQLNIAYSLTSAGHGLSFATDTMLRFEKNVEDVVIYNVEPDFSTRNLYAATKKDTYITTAVKKFIELTEDLLSAE
jgi:DNA-binding transcriptional LysR family regulator